MPRTTTHSTISAATLRQATALVASLSLLVPSAPLMAQEGETTIAEGILAECTAEFEGDTEALADCVGERTQAEIEAMEGQIAGEGAVITDADGSVEAEGAVGGGDAVDGDGAVEAAEAVEETVEADGPIEEGVGVGSGEIIDGEAAVDAEEIVEDAVAAEEADAEAAESDAESDAMAEEAPSAEAAPLVVEAPAAEEDGDAAAAEVSEDVAEDAQGEEADAAAEMNDAAADDAEMAGEEETEESDAALALQEDENGAEALSDAGEADTAAEAPAAEQETAADAPAEAEAEAAAEEQAETDAEVAAEAEAESEAEAEVAAEEDAEAGAAAEAAAAPEAEVAPIVETPTESEIADEIAAQPEPELTEEQQVARDQASRALETLSDNDGGTVAAAAAASDDAEAAEVEEEVIAEEDVRSSDEDFETQAVVTERDEDDDDGLSRTQKIALGALGALAVGTVLANRNRVVSNSGDRVVVQRDDGGLQVLKDDDALLRQGGNEVRTERFDDGSTRTTVLRPDGSRIVTIRDASLRVLRRKLIEADGTEYTLIDDTAEVEPVDVATLPAPIVSSRSGNDDDALRAALNREAGLDRRFSLAQVRSIPQVRALAPAFEVDTVTFASGSAAITPEQAGNLTGLAREVLAAIRENPREVFLIEGHTDAVGDAAYNLALSDRRAETLALALNEYFGVPVENMVVQGYGEQFLKVPTQGAERANRRATVRQITGLLQTAAAN